MAQPHPLHVLTVGWLHACRHTFTHPDLADVTDNVFRSQMHDAQAAIESAICVKPRFMRPPYGSLPKAKQELVESMGYKAVTWNLNVEDWKYAREDREKLVDSVLNATNRYPESIVQLQHDWYEESVSVVAQMVDAIRGAGYRLVTMDECAYGKGACVNRSGSLLVLHPWPPHNVAAPLSVWIPDYVNHASTAFSRLEFGCKGIPASNTQQCATSEWSAFGPCNSTCSTGSKTRTRVITAGTERACFHVKRSDTQPCVCCLQQAVVSATKVTVQENSTAAGAGAAQYTLKPQCVLATPTDRMTIVISTPSNACVGCHTC